MSVFEDIFNMHLQLVFAAVLHLISSIVCVLACQGSRIVELPTTVATVDVVVRSSGDH